MTRTYRIVPDRPTTPEAALKPTRREEELTALGGAAVAGGIAGGATYQAIGGAGLVAMGEAVGLTFWPFVLIGAALFVGIAAVCQCCVEDQ